MPPKAKSDPRFSPLRDHIAATWLEREGFQLPTDGSDWASVVRMLRGAPTLSLAQFCGSWDGFLCARAKDAFYQRQKPVRFWSTNPTPWLRPAAACRGPVRQPDLVEATEQECKLWAQACANIVAQIGSHSYEQWIRPLVLVRFGERVVVRAPNRTFGRWVEQLHGGALRAAAGREVVVE